MMQLSLCGANAFKGFTLQEGDNVNQPMKLYIAPLPDPYSESQAKLVELRRGTILEVR